MISRMARSRHVMHLVLRGGTPNLKPFNAINSFNPIIQTPKRFDGSYSHYQNYAEGPIPKKNGNRADDHLDESEVVTRMMWVLKEFGIYDLKAINWTTNWDDQGIDSLE